MDYDNLSKLKVEDLLTGLHIGYYNARDLVESAHILAEKGKYPQAAAMVILSVEELMKTYSIFLIIMGVEDKGMINAPFKIDKKESVHKIRFKLASGYNAAFNKIPINSLAEQIFSQFTEKDMEIFKNVKQLNDLGDFLPELMEKVKSKIDMEDLTKSFSNEEIEKEVNDQANWFLYAQTLKEDCLYFNYENKHWKNPSSLSKSKYEEAFNKAKDLFNKLGDPIENVIESPKSVEFLRAIFKNVNQPEKGDSSQQE